MEMKSWQLMVLAVVLMAIAGVLLYVSEIGARHRAKSITSFDECVAAGNPVMESYPEQCRSQDGRTFVNPRQQADTPQALAPAAQPSVTPPLSDPPTPKLPVLKNTCKPGGCSGELCTEAGTTDPIMSTCIYRPEYACYKSARCERQASGKCGWTQTPELQSCISSTSQAPEDQMVY